ncbi:ATP-binding protein [Yaniella halotolerans]|uniref:ATP-binding protein n=1 Tax=Yaniella halotolerans TaxID=225453 RepID=UPI0003B5A3B3|nr:DUF4143 domain-containing protein [Yaniella halotolerans]
MPRVVDAELLSALRRAGAVLMEGPRACGKTETALQVARSSVRLDRDPSIVDLIGIDPTLVLNGAVPRLFDEWQVAPELWNIVRGEVDARREKGQFILTGSTAPVADAVRHTGAGRFARVRMGTMTLMETGHSTNDISFSDIMHGESPRAADANLSYRQLVERIVVGGWPGFQDLTAPEVSRNLRDYLNTVAEIDLYATDGVRRDPIRVRRLFAALARSTATEVSLSTLAKDETSLSRDAVRDYLTALERVFITEHQPAWSTHLRSSATLRQEPKRHFVDPSLAVAALGAGVDALLQDPRFTGQLFESLVVQHLRVFSQPLGGTVAHVRDSYGGELDGVVTLPDGSWAGFEIKLGHNKEIIDAAATGLLNFADQVVGPDPSSLTVIVSSGPSYRRRDGVNVVAIGALGL